MEIYIDADQGGFAVTMKCGPQILRQEWVSRKAEAEYLAKKWGHEMSPSDPLYWN